MIKETDQYGGFIRIDYGDGDVREVRFKDTLNCLNELPYRPAKYGLYHETHCCDHGIFDRLARAIWHDIRDVSYADKISDECRETGRVFWLEWMHSNSQDAWATHIFDPTNLLRKARAWVAASDLNFIEKSILVDMLGYFLDNGAFTLTEGIDGKEDYNIWTTWCR